MAKKDLASLIMASTEESPLILGNEKGERKKTILVDNPIYKKPS